MLLLVLGGSEMFMILEEDRVVAYCTSEADARALCEVRSRHDLARTYVKMTQKKVVDTVFE
jgi:hypothetical protein